MRIWIDALTPKQLIFFHFVSERLKESGHEVWFTTRDYHDTNYVVKRLNMHVDVVGRHGGRDLKEKLEASLRRSLELLPLVRDKKPDLALSFSSPEAARVATGLGVMHISVNDSPHSIWVAKLTIPLSSLLFTPWVIPARAWVRYGIENKRIIAYRALDPAVWLKRRDLWPEPTAFESSAKRGLLVRTAETQASYMSKQKFSMLNVAKLLSERFRDRKIILLPRYHEQEQELEMLDEPNVVICKEPFFGPNLISSASLLVGGGGTMNAEAALLGVPVISSYEGPATYVENYLAKSGLLKKVKNERECIREATTLLEENSNKNFATRAKMILSSMEDPSEVIASRIDNL
ncbi:MAG: DUF354 domain-containing protein [Conexivisphaerales archaeon]